MSTDHHIIRHVHADYQPNAAPSHDHAAGPQLDSSVTFTSVGVDIGSSTSHFAVSRLRMAMNGARYVPSGASLVYQSEVLLTPYLDGDQIDSASLSLFLDEQYRRAGLDRGSVDTGAVLLTGVAAERANARKVAELFADSTGKFVAVSAGHHLEAELGARGSGALLASRLTDRRVLHLDVGGGTTKLVYCERGRIAATGAIAVGARLLVRDGRDRIVRLERAGRVALTALGIPAVLGDRLADSDVSAVAEYLAQQVVGVAAALGTASVADGFLLTEQLTVGPIDAISFSGGLAEYIYGRETERFGDLGPDLARAIRARIEYLETPIIEPRSSGIRATVMGASQFTARMTSQTILVDPPEALPLRNLPAVVVSVDDPTILADEIRLAAQARDIDLDDQSCAVALRWTGSATYHRIGQTCAGLLEALAKPDRAGPFVVIADEDVGRLLGLHIREHGLYSGPIVCVDGIDLEPFDYVDISAPQTPNGVTTVVVRSLVFPA